MYFFRKISKKCLHFRICCYIMSSLNELRSVLRTVHINMLSTLFFFINISTGKTTGSARRFSFSRLFSFRLFVLVFSCRSLPGLFICRFPNRFYPSLFAPTFDVFARVLTRHERKSAGQNRHGFKSRQPKLLPRFLSVTFAASFLMLLLRLLFSCHLLSPFYSCRFLLRFFCLSLSLSVFRGCKETRFSAAYFL